MYEYQKEAKHESTVVAERPRKWELFRCFGFCFVYFLWHRFAVVSSDFPAFCLHTIKWYITSNGKQLCAHLLTFSYSFVSLVRLNLFFSVSVCFFFLSLLFILFVITGTLTSYQTVSDIVNQFFSAINLLRCYMLCARWLLRCMSLTLTPQLPLIFRSFESMQHWFCCVCVPFLEFSA